MARHSVLQNDRSMVTSLQAKDREGLANIVNKICGGARSVGGSANGRVDGFVGRGQEHGSIHFKGESNASLQANASPSAGARWS